ncbi:right-handed parallel beta-helix repeat-containing protein [Candidatus Halobonum tyrrellensis]|uniref:Uncharacterized protein n=1 Tax=Candidatus Halobonum tyrrellensis G22 TaxID=1324957 RepID=V4HAC6_9EURY|nr:right-handed parallel beta-helix repeat-containing protein [Candidatus Halobonum tyrrellensis]ESP87003.1 hypothetical protein K933_15827 [Candidatus Halobonum tyrrellensis G22]
MADSDSRSRRDVQADEASAERTWSGDVDANGHALGNLGAVEVDRVYTAAREADVVVWKDDDGTFYADGRDGPVAEGERVLPVAQAAVDSLSEGRSSAEKVLVASPGEVTAADEPLDLPSYTTLDAPVTLTGTEGAPLVVQATGAEHVTVESLSVEGPAGGMRFTSCSNLRIGDVNLVGVTGDGIRIDGRGDAPRTTDVQIDQVYVEGNGHHGVETYGVDRIQIDQVIGVDPASCVVLLNDTTDATVNSVVGREPGVPPGYATFRVANGAHDVTVGEVVSRGGARGIFGVSECYDVTIGEVNVVGARDQGILIQNCQNFTVEGGVVKNTDADAVRVDSRNDGEQIPAEGVSISNLRVVDDRDDPAQTWAILETGPACNHNRFVNNDVRGGGTDGLIGVFSNSTVVRGNVGGGFADGTTTLTTGASPAARVEGISEFDDRTIPGSVDELEEFEQSAFETRAEPTDAPDASYAWETFYEWDADAGAWDLVFEWRVDPGTDLELDYVVDKVR